MSNDDKSHRQTVFVSEHHLKEVRKHWEKLVIEYADKPYRTDTSQPVACVTNDAINLARGIQAAPSARGDIAVQPWALAILVHIAQLQRNNRALSAAAHAALEHAEQLMAATDGGADK